MIHTGLGTNSIYSVHTFIVTLWVVALTGRDNLRLISRRKKRMRTISSSNYFYHEKNELKRIEFVARPGTQNDRTVRILFVTFYFQDTAMCMFIFCSAFWLRFSKNFARVFGKRMLSFLWKCVFGMKQISQVSTVVFAIDWHCLLCDHWW